MSWTQRLGLGVLSALGLMAIETEWFGLLPGSSRNLVADSCVLALIALYARVSAVGAASALFGALWVLYLDQATVGLGVPPLPFVPPADFWITTVLRASLAWGAFGLLTGLAGRRAPYRAVGLVAAAALLLLPFLRYSEWDSVISALAHPFGQLFVVLSVPWLPLVALTAIVAAAASVAPSARRVTVVVAVALVAVGAPLTAYATDELRLGAGLDVAPPTAGPLDAVTLRTRFDPGAAIEAFWDGAPMRSGPALAARPIRLGSVTSFTFYPAAQAALTPGAHRVALVAGLDARQGAFTLLPPADGLEIVVAADGRVVVRGQAAERIRVAVRADSGELQIFEPVMDGSGEWHADLPLPAGHFRLIAQSGSRWTAIDVEVR